MLITLGLDAKLSKLLMQRAAHGVRVNGWFCVFGIIIFLNLSDGHH